MPILILGTGGWANERVSLFAPLQHAICAKGIFIYDVRSILRGEGDLALQQMIFLIGCVTVTLTRGRGSKIPNIVCEWPPRRRYHGLDVWKALLSPKFASST